MRLEVNIDEGIAINLDKVAACMRSKDTRQTVVVLVSGNQFIIDKPLSETIEIINGLNHTEIDQVSKAEGRSGS
ncbi:hypothetical protein [Salmonella enterica]|uniref:hypothetical protein n=1 Tax=Salmonella enterica TaxID=28901 RepID=UPI001880484F|nr:hypothetical protein [Salmonella enterica]